MLKKKKSEVEKSVGGDTVIQIYYLNFWTDSIEMLGKQDSTVCALKNLCPSFTMIHTLHSFSNTT